MEIHGRKTSEDYCWVLGLRNSHDKTFPAGIVAGASVLRLRQPLSFSGEVKFARKHTRSSTGTCRNSSNAPSVCCMASGMIRTNGSKPTRNAEINDADSPRPGHSRLWMSACAPTATSLPCSMNGVNLGMRNSRSATSGHCSTRSRRPSRREIWLSCRSGLKLCTGCWMWLWGSTDAKISVPLHVGRFSLAVRRWRITI